MAIKINSKDELNPILEKIRRGVLPPDYLVEADFLGGDFSEVDFSGIDLTRANFTGTNLTEANLSRADLLVANLSNVNLSWANLSFANFSWANLSGANLSGANLSKADLSWANLYKANLYRANLSEADISVANMIETQTEAVQFHKTRVGGTIFSEGFEKSLEFLRTRILPEGDIIGWEMCPNDVLVKLRIPAKSPRCHAFSRKCRTAYAEVLEVIGGKRGINYYAGEEIIYEVGKPVYANKFDPDWRYEDSNGIYFYLTRGEAEAH